MTQYRAFSKQRVVSSTLTWRNSNVAAWRDGAGRRAHPNALARAYFFAPKH
jgi:hypothetical protein